MRGAEPGNSGLRGGVAHPAYAVHTGLTSLRGTGPSRSAAFAHSRAADRAVPANDIAAPAKDLCVGTGHSPCGRGCRGHECSCSCLAVGVYSITGAGKMITCGALTGAVSTMRHADGHTATPIASSWPRPGPALRIPQLVI